MPTRTGNWSEFAKSCTKDGEPLNCLCQGEHAPFFGNPADPLLAEWTDKINALCREAQSQISIKAQKDIRLAIIINNGLPSLGWCNPSPSGDSAFPLDAIQPIPPTSQSESSASA
jgi:hypothetical protein